MCTFASTFIPGFTPFIEDQLRKQVKNIQILNTFDGLIVYKTSSDWDTLKNLKFLNNTYLVICETNNVNRRVIERMREQLDVLDNLPKSAKSFRIVISKENEMKPIDSHLRVQLESDISFLSDLKVNRNKPDVEFWFLFRAENYGFFGIRITKHPDYKKVLPAGELRPELANLLCLLAEPDNQDVFLDPFAGYGSITYQRAKIAKYRKIIASDINIERAAFLKTKLRGFKNIVIDKADALNLTSIGDASIDCVVTDPPWGYYENKDTDFNVFFPQVLNEMNRIIKPGGLLVLMTAKKEEFVSALNNTPAFDLKVKYDILVSGKKAAVYKLIKV